MDQAGGKGMQTSPNGDLSLRLLWSPPGVASAQSWLSELYSPRVQELSNHGNPHQAHEVGCKVVHAADKVETELREPKGRSKCLPEDVRGRREHVTLQLLFEGLVWA